MTFETQELKAMPEYIMLKYVVVNYEQNHPHEKAIQAIASALMISPDALTNYLNGKGHLGYEGLLKLAEYANCPLVIDWINSKSKK